MRIFVQNYKKMDISAFIVGLGVTLLIAAFESSGKKSKNLPLKLRRRVVLRYVRQ